MDTARPVAVIPGEVVTPPASARHTVKHRNGPHTSRQTDHSQAALGEELWKREPVKTRRTRVVERRSGAMAVPPTVQKTHEAIERRRYFRCVVEEVNTQTAATLEHAPMLLEGAPFG